MGGGVALAYALRYPEDVSGLVLISPSYRPRDATRVDYQIAATPVLGRIMAFLTPRFLVERQLRGVVYDDSLVTDAMVDRYRDLILHKGNRVAAIERLAGYAAARPDRLAERLGEIQQPTLVLWGEADFRNPVANAFALERALPHAQLVVYSEVAHVAMEEVPEASAARVRTFLAPFERNSQPTPGRAGAL